MIGKEKIEGKGTRRIWKKAVREGVGVSREWVQMGMEEMVMKRN